ncbi:hypothetical protein ACFWCB_22835 [Streptomyces sp. NPDC060048]|uniref:hypothetical protein n=1 Tax=unclassified Streptomyces TaxID=2593676 RepID=UPI0036CC1494
MSQESAPETRRQDCQTGQAADDNARRESAVPAQGGARKGLLQQMEEMMAALNADLSQLDADLQSSTDRSPGTPLPQGGHAPGSEGRPPYRSH